MKPLGLIAAAFVATTGLNLVGFAAMIAVGHRGDEPLAAPPPRSTPVPVSVPPAPAPPKIEEDRTVIRGRVIDPTGRPVAGAIVRPMVPVDPTTATTGPDGWFSLPREKKSRSDEPSRWSSDPGRLNPPLVASARGFGPGWIMGDTGGREPMVIRLVPPGPAVEGRIVTEDHQPVVGATVQVRSLHEPIRPTTSGESGSPAPHRGSSHPVVVLERTATLPAAATATTDADGRFRFGDLGAERLVVLLATGPTIEVTEIVASTRAEGDPIEVRRQEPRPWTDRCVPARFERVVAPTRAITGVITDAATGDPLAGWKIQGSVAASPAEVADHVEAASDAEGRYTLTGLPRAGAYRVFMAPPVGQPYLPAGFSRVEAPDGVGPITVNLATTRAVVVRGRVTDKRTGEPVAGTLQAGSFAANPHVRDYPGYAESRLMDHSTAADGRYQVVLPPGPAVVGFRAGEGAFRSAQGAEEIAGLIRGFAFDWADRFPTVGRAIHPSHFHSLAGVNPPVGTEPTTLDIQAESFRTVTLSVVDPGGRPVEDLLIEGIDQAFDWQSRWYDSSPVSLVVTRPRRITARQIDRKLVGSVEIATTGPASMTLQLGPWGEVKGRILQDDGTPPPYLDINSGFNAQPRPRTEPFGVLSYVNRPHDHFDPSGRFHLVGLVPGLHYRAAVATAKSRSTGDLFDDLTTLPGEVKDVGTVRLVRPR